MAQKRVCSVDVSWLKKSQALSCAVAAWGISLSDRGLTAWIRSGNWMASWMKKTGMLLPTMSKLPSSVKLPRSVRHVPQCAMRYRHTYSLTAKPWTSRAVSALPREPATVEKRTNVGVFLSLAPKKDAAVMLLKSP